MSAKQSISNAYIFEVNGITVGPISVNDLHKKYGFSIRFIYGAIKGEVSTRHGLVFVRTAGKVFGDFHLWLKSKKLRSVADQCHEPSKGIGDNGIMILWAYRNTPIGIKPLAKKYQVSGATVMAFLKSAGLDTRKKSNYARCDSVSDTSEYRRLHNKKAVSTVSGMMRKRIMNRIQVALKKKSVNQSGHFGMIGCNADQLRNHIESQFCDGMNWQNYGATWEVDHKKPVSWFNLNDESERIKAFSYNNLQPMLVAENRKKGNRHACI
jgi:hypothetical protein